MKLCSKLVFDINFEPDALQPCCNINGVATLPRFPFTGGAVDMDAYKKHVFTAIQQMQEENGLCAGCPELTDFDGDIRSMRSFDPTFQTVSINKHRYLCNCRCVYCTFWKGNGDSYSILPAIKSLHDQNALRQGCVFSWGGGEPSILVEFEETCNWLLKQRIYWQYIHTNALRYSPAIAKVLKRDAGKINISLDAGTPETYYAVKGVKKFEAVVKNLFQYAAESTDKSFIELKYIVFERNNSPTEIDHFFALCSKLGVCTVFLSLNFIEVNQKCVSDATLHGAAYFLAKAPEYGLQAKPFFMPKAYNELIDRLAQQIARQ